MTGTLALIAGMLCVAGTIYGLIKRLETRLVLFLAGLVMCTLAFNPMGALDAFAGRMVTAGLIQAICSVMGFAFVMQYTKCDQQLVNLFTGMMGKLGIFIIPASTLITFAINIPLTSAAGCAAAVGAVLVPLMMSRGVHPATAAAAVALGTYGSAMSPGNSHNPFVANLANMELMEVIAIHAPYTAISGVIGAVVITIVALVTKTHTGYVYEGAAEAGEGKQKVNLLMAIAPVFPIVLLIGSNSGWFGDIKIGVAQAMLVGAVYAVAITRSNPAEVTKKFFDGMGKAYGDVIGIIIAAAVFVAGMKSLGVIDAAITSLIANPEIAAFGGTFGPMLLAIITGSGDAAAFAFNEAVTPFAPQMGMEIANLGSAVQLSGAMGRTMSPLSGALIVLAGLAKVDTMEVAKKTALPMLATVVFLLVFFI
ncbi:C4-dicarboxylate transporter DcuC [Parendozoicomonas haliclonae]|uniref:C4-dicarboxylate transporter DcuC n=1 Tax=Parendozoicomonas haliclonae TaxID=1960125 RepID=UPI001F601180|nr:C4-dicarboxylate transporter DcuC [Parendozoicomonas haliclonae]